MVATITKEKTEKLWQRKDVYIFKAIFPVVLKLYRNTKILASPVFWAGRRTEVDLLGRGGNVICNFCHPVSHLTCKPAAIRFISGT